MASLFLNLAFDASVVVKGSNGLKGKQSVKEGSNRF